MLAYSAEGDELWNLPLGPFHNQMGMAASPILVEYQGLRQIVTAMSQSILGVRASDGKLLWKFRGTPDDKQDRKLMGNGRLVSMFPARGGPVPRISNPQPHGQRTTLLLSSSVFSAIVVMVMVTTIITPPALSWSLARTRKT